MVGFKTKDELYKYYRAADVFVLPTREDIWGLVINEAMAFGLPVVSTDKCLAAVELIEDEKNGFVVRVEDVQSLSRAIVTLLQQDDTAISYNNLAKIKNYTYESVINSHIKAINKISN